MSRSEECGDVNRDNIHEHGYIGDRWRCREHDLNRSDCSDSDIAEAGKYCWSACAELRSDRYTARCALTGSDQRLTWELQYPHRNREG